MKEKRELIKNTIIISIGKFSTKMISFLLLPLYTAILLPAEKGEVDLLNRISMFLMPLITLQMEEALFRFLIETKSKSDKKEIFSGVLLFSLLSSILWSIVIYIVGNLLNYQYTTWLIIYSLASFVYALCEGFLRGEGKLKAYSILAFLNSVINIGLNILFLVVLKTGLEGMFLAYIIATFLTGFIGLIYVKSYKFASFKINKTKIKAMFSYALPLVPTTISWSVISITDGLMIKANLGAAMNGIYATSLTFPTILNTLYSFFNISWRESASKMVNKKNKDEFYISIYMSLKRMLLGGLLLIIGFLPVTFNILINKNYNDSYLYIPFILISVYFSCLASFSSGIFSAYKDTKILATTTYVVALVNLIIDFLLINKIGLFAPILGTLISYMIVWIYRNYKLRKYLTLPLDNYFIWNIIVVSLVMATYYSKNMILYIIGLMLSIIYSYWINRNLIKRIIKKVFKKK